MAKDLGAGGGVQAQGCPLPLPTHSPESGSQAEVEEEEEEEGEGWGGRNSGQKLAAPAAPHLEGTGLRARSGKAPGGGVGTQC